MRTYLGDALKLRNQVSALDEMLNQIVAARQKIAEAESGVRQDNVVQQARKLDAQLQRLEVELFNAQIQHNAPEDMLHALFRTYGKLTRLSEVVSFSYYELPSAPMVSAMQTLGQQLDSALDQYNQIVSSDMPALNRALTGAGAIPIKGVTEIKIQPVVMP